MKKKKPLISAALAIATITVLSSCSDNGASGQENVADSRVIVATTSILADVASEILGEEATVVTLMPAGSDPHNYQLSTREVATLMSADLIIENGLGLEESVAPALAAARADGISFLTVGDHINPLSAESDDHDDHDGEDDDHDHGFYDPHFWHDANRMATAAKVMAEKLGEIGVKTPNADGYIEELLELDAELQATYSAIPPENRKLVTGHRVFEYLADRYQLEIIGSVIPSNSTLASASAADITKIARAIEDSGVQAIFTDASQSTRVAETIVKEVRSPVTIVPLFSESLTSGGEADSYTALMRQNAKLISAALHHG